jgi:zinc/manganese transport system substrate-binding protein
MIDSRFHFRYAAEVTRTLAGYLALAAVVAVAGTALAVTGSTGTTAAGRVRVVAAENVYAAIARQIGGGRVAVRSILSDPNADPHLFEPGTANALAVAQAAVVIQNGAGYDVFMGRLEAAAPSPGRRVVTIADVLGVRGPDANPHLWYDVPRLGVIGAAIAAVLERADPAGRDAYRAGLRRFDRNLGALRREVALIRSRYAGTPVADTEPVPGYLLAAAGLAVETPPAFARAIEDGSEPSPRAVSQMQSLLTGRRVRVLLVNTQVVSPITQRMRSAAIAAGIPVVGVRETVPAGVSFERWQFDQARALQRALER